MVQKVLGRWEKLWKWKAIKFWEEPLTKLNDEKTCQIERFTKIRGKFGILKGEKFCQIEMLEISIEKNPRNWNMKKPSKHFEK